MKKRIGRYYESLVKYTNKRLKKLYKKFKK